jgi:DegV family protein with EDD domain
MAVRVVTDSSCDLPADVVADHGIDVVPLTIRFGEEEFVDRVDLTPAQFWARCASSPALPETAAPAPGAFQEAFRRAAEAGADGVVCINLAAKLSATSQAALTAADAVSDDIPVKVVDSKSVTLGLGMIVVEAARLAAAGGTLDDVTAAAEDLAGRPASMAPSTLSST